MRFGETERPQQWYLPAYLEGCWMRLVYIFIFKIHKYNKMHMHIYTKQICTYFSNTPLHASKISQINPCLYLFQTILIQYLLLLKFVILYFIVIDICFWYIIMIIIFLNRVHQFMMRQWLWHDYTMIRHIDLKLITRSCSWFNLYINLFIMILNL